MPSEYLAHHRVTVSILPEKFPVVFRQKIVEFGRSYADFYGYLRSGFSYRLYEGGSSNIQSHKIEAGRLFPVRMSCNSVVYIEMGPEIKSNLLRSSLHEGFSRRIE